MRSARCQSAHWVDGDLRIVNYLTRGSFSANPVVLEVIRFFFSPRTIRDAMLEFGSYTRESVGEAILKLIGAQLLLECGSPESARDDLLDSLWKPWLPEGGFHFLTKDAPYVGGDWTVEQMMQTVPSTPPPPQFKKTEGAESISLPYHETEQDSFFQTLHARRTLRKFSKADISLDTVSKLLQTTWGVQGYLESKSFGPLPFKTSPSGGARHPIEVYLMALGVKGLDPGVYHYDARGHALERISSQATPQMARDYCADQPFAAGSAALFIMTGVFARTMWKYHHPRAYRVVLLDAGHLGQTFCLTATRLGLAPFSTAALKDSLIEKDLGIDGISESVLYVTGVGVPAGR
ncbi:MAG TPA: SagB family peptide dehydrogenase [Steroidobacteraceae bacterium]|nr:SagB family peptide dehydrogenase [Steroidobacteraceae bacterium]